MLLMRMLIAFTVFAAATTAKSTRRTTPVDAVKRSLPSVPPRNNRASRTTSVEHRQLNK